MNVCFLAGIIWKHTENDTLTELGETAFAEFGKLILQNKPAQECYMNAAFI